MANGDHEPGPHEDLHLAEENGLRLVDVPGGPQDDEQRIVVPLQLRPLMRFDRVLDCELVQLELTSDSLELVLAGLIEAEPRDGIAGLAGGVQLRQIVGLSRPTTFAVDRPINDHPRTLPLPGKQATLRYLTEDDQVCGSGHPRTAPPAHVLTREEWARFRRSSGRVKGKGSAR